MCYSADEDVDCDLSEDGACTAFVQTRGDKFHFRPEDNDTRGKEARQPRLVPNEEEAAEVDMMGSRHHAGTHEEWRTIQGEGEGEGEGAEKECYNHADWTLGAVSDGYTSNGVKGQNQTTSIRYLKIGAVGGQHVDMMVEPFVDMWMPSKTWTESERGLGSSGMKSNGMGKVNAMSGHETVLTFPSSSMVLTRRS